MKTILITAIGGDVAQAVASIIREVRPGIKIVGVDMSIRHGGMLFVDNFIQIKAANEPDYLDILSEIMDKFEVDALIPMSEYELIKFVNTGSFLAGRPVIHCGDKALEVGLDKLKTVKYLYSMGIPMPWTMLVKDGNPPKLPCILKPRNGSGSKSVFLVKDKVDVEYFNQKYSESIYQELLLPDDKEVTCAVYRTKDGLISVLQLLRQLVGGQTGWAEVIKNGEVELLCRKVAKFLDLSGSINIQLRITKDGPKIFEINPRFSSTVQMRHKLGFSDVIWSISEIEGNKIKFPKITVGQKIVKKQEVSVLSD